jgi:hypothetical protein
MSKVYLSSGLIVLAISCQAQQNGPPRSTNWWERELWNRLSYSGSRTLGYQSYSFEGDADAFSSLTNYGTGNQRFTDIGSFSVQGSKVFGLLDFRASFTDNRFSDPEQQQYTLNYKRGFWDVSYGTVQASLITGNRFTHFSRSLRGIVGGYKTGKFEAKAISSSARGAARTLTIEGNNTPGPYYLSGGRIIGGTIKILLDGIELRQGVDYLADVNVGSVTFIGRSVAPTSTIIASFESYDITGSGGSIQGASFSYDLGKAGKIGFTAQQQKTGNASSTNGRIESFQGFGFAGAQYNLLFEPIPASIIVTVDGIIRTFSVIDDGLSEFYLSNNNPLIVISRGAVPTTQTIQIRYLPKLVLAVDGDRQVTGFDWRIPLGPKGSSSFVTYSRANGKLTGSAPSKGEAQAIDLRLAKGKSEFKMGLRKVDPGFRTIEQTGFSRNENATEYTLDYSTKGLSSTINTANNVISVNNGGTTTNNRLVTSGVVLRYSDPKNAAKNLSRFQTLSWNNTQVRAADNTRVTSLGFKDNYRFKKLSFGYGVENLTGRGKVNGTLTGIGVRSYRTNATYDVGRNWLITGSASKSNVNTDTIKSQGYDYSLRANMTQTGPWAFGADYTLSDSGELASLGGFLNGNSLGYGNNGFGNSGGIGTLSTGQLKARRAAFNVTHQAGDNLSMQMTYSNTTSVGSSTSNARIEALLLDVGWRINDAHSFFFNWSKAKSNFLSSSTGTNNSDVIAGTFTGNPGKFWNYTLGYNALKSTGSQLGQDSLGLSVDVTYRVDPRQRLFMNASSNKTRGLYPQDDTTFQAGYAYNLVSGISLIGKYNFRNLKNLDPLATGGAFRAKGLSIELSFDLSNRR